MTEKCLKAMDKEHYKHKKTPVALFQHTGATFQPTTSQNNLGRGDLYRLYYDVLHRHRGRLIR